MNFPVVPFGELCGAQLVSVIEVRTPHFTVTLRKRVDLLPSAKSKYPMNGWYVIGASCRSLQ